jgi:hypothetical protein
MHTFWSKYDAGIFNITISNCGYKNTPVDWTRNGTTYATLKTGRLSDGGSVTERKSSKENTSPRK